MKLSFADIFITWRHAVLLLAGAGSVLLIFGAIASRFLEGMGLGLLWGAIFCALAALRDKEEKKEEAKDETKSTPTT